MRIDFKHIQTAHCENGVTTALLRHNGIDILNEPLVFGIGSGLFYIQIPFLKINNGPAISFRTMPGKIFLRTCNSLDITVVHKKFSSHTKAKEFLDSKLNEGVPVGCQVGVFHLPYFPKEYRFHFNAHNIIVFGRNNDIYQISDPVMENTTEISSEDLEKVRFAKGIFAPKGHLYYPVLPVKSDIIMLRKAIVRGIRRNTRDMLFIPGNVAGVRGIKFTSRKIRKWREKFGLRKAGLYLAQIVRMQEEIGTGGGGFRFLYAAFLEQASEILKDDKLIDVSNEFTKAGDLWRASAIQMAGIYKGRLGEQKDFDETADMLVQIYNIEKEAFRKLNKHKFNL